MFLKIIVVMIVVVVVAYLLRFYRGADELKEKRIETAKDHLSYLRNQIPGYSGWERNIRTDVRKGWYRYSDLGVTEEELMKLGKMLREKECGRLFSGNIRARA